MWGISELAEELAALQEECFSILSVGWSVSQSQVMSTDINYCSNTSSDIPA